MKFLAFRDHFFSFSYKNEHNKDVNMELGGSNKGQVPNIFYVLLTHNKPPILPMCGEKMVECRKQKVMV